MRLRGDVRFRRVTYSSHLVQALKRMGTVDASRLIELTRLTARTLTASSHMSFKVEMGVHNTALTVILFIAVLVGIALIVVLSINLTTTTISLEGSGSVISSKTLCSQLTSGLLNVSNDPFCTGRGNAKYDSELQLIITPSEVWYQSVCSQFCPSGEYDFSNDTCNDDDPEIANRVKRCVTALKPVDCVGQAKPVAISNGTLYYGSVASLETCVV